MAYVAGIDESIYLLCYNVDSKAPFCCKIEDKEIAIDDHGLNEQNKADVDFTFKGRIREIVDFRSRLRMVDFRSRLRMGHFPVFPFQVLTTRIAALNSCIYLVGGYKYDAEDDIKRPPLYSEVQFFDFKLPIKGWQNGPNLPFPAVYRTVATSENGSILLHYNYMTRQHDSLWLNPHSHEGWEKVPKPPSDLCPDFDCANFIALTDTGVFWFAPGLKKASYYLYFFDFKNWKWQSLANITNFYDRFQFQGVVFYETYLFLYGSRQDSNKEKMEKGNFYLHVYDLKACQFMSESVACSHECLEHMPSVNASACYLFRMRDNKVAIVWQRNLRGPNSNDVILWIKLIIHKEYSRSGSELQFRAEVYDYGQCIISGKMINCALQVIVREEHEKNSVERKAGEECHMIVEQDGWQRKVGHSVFLLGSSLAALYLLKRVLF